MSNPKPSKSLKEARREWACKEVVCRIRDEANRSFGPYRGRVSGIADNEVAAIDENSKEYNETGLLVDIYELPRNAIYGEWPVRFGDAELIDV